MACERTRVTRLSPYGQFGADQAEMFADALTEALGRRREQRPELIDFAVTVEENAEVAGVSVTVLVEDHEDAHVACAGAIFTSSAMVAHPNEGGGA